MTGPLIDLRAADPAPVDAALRDAVVTPLAPPLGRRPGLPPVVSAPFIKQRLDAISV